MLHSPISSARAAQPNQRREVELMKLKSGAGIVCYVKDISKTIDFYETAWFRVQAKGIHASHRVHQLVVD